MGGTLRASRRGLTGVGKSIPSVTLLEMEVLASPTNLSSNPQNTENLRGQMTSPDSQAGQVTGPGAELEGGDTYSLILVRNAAFVPGEEASCSFLQSRDSVCVFVGSSNQPEIHVLFLPRGIVLAQPFFSGPFMGSD